MNEKPKSIAIAEDSYADLAFELTGLSQHLKSQLEPAARATLSKRRDEVALSIERLLNTPKQKPDLSRNHVTVRRIERTSRVGDGPELHQVLLMQMGHYEPALDQYRRPVGLCPELSGRARGRSIQLEGSGPGQAETPFSPRSGGWATYEEDDALMRFIAFMVDPCVGPLFPRVMKSNLISVQWYDLPAAPCAGVMHWQYDIAGIASFTVSHGIAWGRLWYYPHVLQPDITQYEGDHYVTIGGNAPILLESWVTAPRIGTFPVRVSAHYEANPGQRGRVWVVCGYKIMTFCGGMHIGNPHDWLDALIAVTDPLTAYAGVRYQFEPRLG